MIIHNFLHSLVLLSECSVAFADKCVAGVVANKDQIAAHLTNSLMLITALNPYIGYDKGRCVLNSDFVIVLTGMTECLCDSNSSMPTVWL
jgi:fumarate hydratase class II